MLHNQKLIKSCNIIINNIDGEVVVLNKDTKKLFTLNQTAEYLINNCEGKTIDELIKVFFDNLNNKQTLSFSDIASDCERLLKQMLETGLINFSS